MQEVRLDKSVRDAMWIGLVLGILGVILLAGTIVAALPELRAGMAAGEPSLAWLGVAALAASLLLNAGVAALCLRALRGRRARDLRRLRALAAVGALLSVANVVGLILMLIVAMRAHQALTAAAPPIVGPAAPDA